MAGRRDNFICWPSAAASLGLHLAVLIWLVSGAPLKPREIYQPLAVMDFMVYDPEGGQPGGGAGGESAQAEPEQAQTGQAALEPEPEETPLPVESAAEKADPLPLRPPEIPPPKAPSKPKPAPSKPKDSPATAAPDGEGSGLPGRPSSGRGGEGGGSGQGTSDALRAYQAQIRRKLERNKKYPPTAQARRLTGVATVGFTVHRDGSVSAVRLVGSSGQPLLDDEVMALLRRVSPLPPIPPEIAANSLTLKVPLRFSIR